ncbi:MAG: modulated transcriptional regulator, LuxR family [Marmoricola sp.]|nr:modulated transcriptional regulator, LuxR family [Marmoricola sp.]
MAERQQRLARTLRSFAESAPSDDPIRALTEVADRWESSAVSTADVADLIADMEAARAELVRKPGSRPLLASRRVSAALDRIRTGSTYQDVVRAAPAELCWAGDFDRVLLSRVEGSTWRPEAWHAAGEQLSAQTMAFGVFVNGAEIALGSGMIEAEVIRRRKTVLVGSASEESRTLPALVDVAGCTSYVVAPIVAADQVVGLIHADAQPSGRVLDECDRVTLRSFADGLGLVLERLALLDTIGTRRDQISAALAAAERAVEELSTAPVNLEVTSTHADTAASSSQAVPLDRLLTAREREVFAVLVSGATNAQIADRLTVSETTVKSHVKHILRKMRAANRAEAIARYLTMSANQIRGS